MENIIINIDSDFRNKKVFPNPGSFKYKLKESLKNISYIRLSSIELPLIYYTFTSQNNNINFIILYNDESFNIIIKEGNYDSANIVTEIQSKFDIINNNYSTNFKISWDIINYKITITNTDPFTLIFDNNNENRTLGNHLGYLQDNEGYLGTNQLTKYDFATNTNLYFWTADTVLDITKDDYLYLRINDYGVIYNDVRTTGILAKIILYEAQFIVETGANFLTKSYQFKQPTTIHNFDIKLLNKRGQTVDMNYINFSFTLELGQIYDKNQYSNYNFQVK